MLKNKASGLVVLIIAFILFAGGLTYYLSKEKNNTGQTAELFGEGFINRLEASGYAVKDVEFEPYVVKHTFFAVYPKYIYAGKEQLSIYEFDSPKTAANQAKTISNDGYSIGNAMIDWVDKPHFFVKGNLIVGYIGSNKELIGVLEKLLGKPVTK